MTGRWGRLRFNGAATVRSRIGEGEGEGEGEDEGAELQWGRDRQVADSGCPLPSLLA